MAAATPATKPKRALFNRPKWAAAPATGQNHSQSGNTANAADFFSRSDQTFGAIAAEEEERLRRRQAKKEAEKLRSLRPATPQNLGRTSQRSPKRRRVSHEVSSDDESDKLNGSEDEQDTGRAGGAQPTGNELQAAIEKGRVLVRESLAQLNAPRSEDATITPLTNLPSNAPMIPEDAQCERLEKKNLKLEAFSHSKIRQSALLMGKRDQEQDQDEDQESQHVMEAVRNFPTNGLRVSTRSEPRLQLQDDTLSETPSTVKKRAPSAGVVDDNRVNTNLSANAADVILVEENNEETPVAKPVVGEPTRILPTIENKDDQTSDDEFAELTRRARQKALSRRMGGAESITPTPEPDGPGVGGTRGGPNVFSPVGAQKLPMNHVRQQPDPVVSLLITSDIPGTKALIINRKLSQRLKEVKLYWCKACGLSEELAKNVVVTWRGRQLFDSQSCKGLGIGVDKDGNFLENDPLDEFQGKIHLVAMTKDDFEQKRARGASTAELESQVGKDKQQGEPPLKKADDGIRIILRSKYYEEFRLIVKPTTVVARIINAFRGANEVPPDNSVALMFDGELLQPNAVMSETEVTDMDHIDVYVR